MQFTLSRMFRPSIDLCKPHGDLPCMQTLGFTARNGTLGSTHHSANKSKDPRTLQPSKRQHAQISTSVASDLVEPEP